MALDTVTNNASDVAAAASKQSRASLSDNFDTFLTLLTSQLQNQDPLSPMDSNQFTQQLVQFSQVEQQIRTNEQLEAMNNQGRAALSGTALSYLGRDALVEDKRGLLGDKGASWTYAFEKEAASVDIDIKDSAGHVVYSASGDEGEGSHVFNWDGKTKNGTRAPNGIYTLVVNARDGDDEAMTSQVTTRLTIRGVDLTAQTPSVLTEAGTHELSTIRTIFDD